jgi:hypothetical protein
MNSTLIHPRINTEEQDTKIEEIRYSSQFFADRIPTVKKTRARRNNNTKVCMMQKPSQSIICEDVSHVQKSKIKRTDTFNLQAPKNIYPKLKEIEQNPPSTIPGFKTSYLKYIIHLICCRVEEDGYAHLKMEYLRKAIPRAEKYISYILQQNIIIRSPYYRKGVKAYGYKFSPAYQSRYVPIQLMDNKLLYRIRKINNKLKKESRGYPAQDRLLEKLTVYPEARIFALSFYEGESLNYALAAITMIENEEVSYIIDDTAGRYHNNVTRLQRELRRYIMTMGIHFVANVDVKNCQPYISILIFTNPQKIAKFAKDPELRMMLKTLKISEEEDVKHYIDLVTSGRLYEYLMEEFNKRGLVCDRDQVKRHVMQILFDCNAHMSKPREIFAELFPTVHGTFSKLRGNKKGNHFAGYQRFAILLQTIEAHVMLRIIYPRLIKELPNVIMLTVHDSILCSKNPEAIAAIMREELGKYVSYQPVLKVEEI